MVDKWQSWRVDSRRLRAERALVRQLVHQEAKARALEGREQELIINRVRAAQRVRGLLEAVTSLPEDARILEVGSGAHGLIFFLGVLHGVGIDPLAAPYAALFPAWQRKARTAAAQGEALPFPDHTFDIVLSNNVVDHAERPDLILQEIARVLAPGGVLYFTVNTHHPFYSLISTLHAMWRALGIPYEIDPFADHTTHLTLAGAQSLFNNLPLRIVWEQAPVAEVKAATRQAKPRHMGDRLKRFFFKNVPFEVIAMREGTDGAGKRA